MIKLAHQDAVVSSPVSRCLARPELADWARDQDADRKSTANANISFVLVYRDFRLSGVVWYRIPRTDRDLR